MIQSPHNPELTICSVYHSAETKKLLELNYELTSQLNTEKNWIWLVADNTPEGFTDKIDGNNFFVVPGVKRSDIPKYVRPWARGSYHHAMAVNNSLKYSKTRFALFLDVDFFITRPNWINEALIYMKNCGLVFFGNPYHPAHFKKYRYFPCAQCLFVDCGKIDINSLDFLPQYDEFFLHGKTLWFRVCKKITKTFPFLESIMQVGASRDTGYKIYKRYFRDKNIFYESVQPVFRPARKSFIGEMVQKLLPGRFSIIPKRQDYYIETGFRDLGYFDAAAEGWEEFVWRGRPFGLHIRGCHKLKDNLEKGIAPVRQALDSFADEKPLKQNY